MTRWLGALGFRTRAILALPRLKTLAVVTTLHVEAGCIVFARIGTAKVIVHLAVEPLEADWADTKVTGNEIDTLASVLAGTAFTLVDIRLTFASSVTG